MLRLLNKYKYHILATIIFVVVILFFADVTLPGLIDIRHNIKEMHEEQMKYRAQAQADSLFLRNMGDDEFLEKYAREKFFMKRDGEEIYVIDTTRQ